MRINKRILLDKREYQKEEQGRKQFYAVDDFDEVGNDRKFIKWFFFLDSAWDSLELCQASLVLD